jgi:hypothetical protein
MKNIILFLSWLAFMNTATAFISSKERLQISRASTLNMYKEDRSIALPFDPRPVNLDGTIPGDAGFDPAG